jgi:hypothetical protein
MHIFATLDMPRTDVIETVENPENIHSLLLLQKQHSDIIVAWCSHSYRELTELVNHVVWIRRVPDSICASQKHLERDIWHL